jgi:hypothetical protein
MVSHDRVEVTPRLVQLGISVSPSAGHHAKHATGADEVKYGGINVMPWAGRRLSVKPKPEFEFCEVGPSGDAQEQGPREGRLL